MSNTNTIKTIPVENISVKDIQDAKVIESNPSKIHAIKNSIIIPLIAFLLLAALAVGAVYFFSNYKVAHGKIEGSLFSVGDFSLIEQSYDPAAYLSVGKTVYYSNGDTGFFGEKLEEGRVVKLSQNLIYIEPKQAGLGEVSVKKSQLVYIGAGE